MPKITSTKSQLSLIPSRVPKIMEVGRENRMQDVTGELRLATVCTKIIYFIVGLHSKTEVKAYLKKNGGTLLGLIEQAVHRFVSEEDDR